jgi:hypothetical protein
MSILNNSLLLGQEGGGGYAISRSLRFNSSDSAYLSRTPASAGNRKTWTWAGWVKRSSLVSGGTYNNAVIFSAGGSNPGFILGFDKDSRNDAIQVNISRGTNAGCLTNAVFRDFSAWMHICLAFDTTQATSANRLRLWVNGVEQTWAQTNYPAQHTDYEVNNTSAHNIGRASQSSAEYFDGLLADLHFCDGTAYDASAFGEFDANGIWQPKKFAGVYGTNGFKLSFSDNSTAAALGTDVSGAGNTWTVNNISVAAGAGNDSLVDVPINGAQTDTGVGGEVRGNYATWNPTLHSLNGNKPNLSNGNLDQGGNISSVGSFALATILPGSGKWYMEVTMANANFGAGIWKTPLSPSLYAYQQTNFRYFGDGGVYNASGSVATYSTFTTGDVIGVALDIDNGKVFFSKNGTWQGSSDPAAGTNPAGSSGIDATWTFGLQSTDSATGTCNVNFGQRSWAYQSPSGFKALCTANLPAPVVTNPSTVMDVLTITGANQAYTGLNFSPDFLWFKRRDNIEFHYLFDVIRGGASLLRTNNSDAEGTGTTYISAFGSNGFTTANGLLVNSASYVTWAWDAGSSTVTNTAGSISSQVRANASAGFSIVTYTGNSTAGATVGHGLGVAPAFIISKSRSNSSEWSCYHQSLGNAQSIILNTTAAASSSSTWNSTSPTSTVITLGVSGSTNFSGYTHVIYAFAPVAGYSSAFSFTGNGSSDGPFCFLGFRPRLILAKRSDGGSENWYLIDSARGAYNVNDKLLNPNTSAAEETYSQVDFLSNGFKIRNTGTGMNANGATMIGFAWAESPFQYARAR